MSSRGSERSRELQELLSRLRPRIVELLKLYEIPSIAAEEIVHDTFVALAVRWDRVSNRETWLLSTIETRCRNVVAGSERKERSLYGAIEDER